MANERPPASAREIEAIVARLVEADFGDGDPEALARLHAHVGDDPGRAAIEMSVRDLWDRLGELERPEALAAPEADVPAEVPGRQWSRIAIAAAILPFLLIVGLSLAIVQPFGQDRYRAELVAAAAERRIVSLPDGSSVSLSADSMVSVDFTRDRRALVLQRGEALFKVAHDAARPFLVTAGGGTIRAVGTAFNVRLARRGVVVTVAEGRVRISAASAAARDAAPAALDQLASAGQQVVFGREKLAIGSSDAAFITPPRKVDADRYTSWAEGVLRFEGEPLEQVIEEVNRYSARRIELRDPRLRTVPIYGMLHIGDVEGLRSIVADIERLDARAASEKLVIPPDQT